MDAVNIRTLAQNGLMTETEAIRLAIHMPTSNGWKNVCVESDSKLVVDELKNQKQEAFRWDIGVIA